MSISFLKIASLTTALLVAPASLAMAQTTTTAPGTTTGSMSTDRDEGGFDLGWLGLIGLLGLAGLRRPKAVAVDQGVRRGV